MASISKFSMASVYFFPQETLHQMRQTDEMKPEKEASYFIPFAMKQDLTFNKMFYLDLNCVFILFVYLCLN